MRSPHHSLLRPAPEARRGLDPERKAVVGSSEVLSCGYERVQDFRAFRV